MSALPRLLRFVVVGGVATAIHYLILITLVQAQLAEPVLATSIGFSISALVNYFLNKQFTFASTRAHSSAFPRFAAVAFLGLGFNAMLMWIFVDLIALHYLVGQVAATVGTLSITFLGNHLWTFRTPA